VSDNNLQKNMTADDQQQVEKNGGLDDLSLTAEQLNGIKGGALTMGGGGGFINNHNETVVSDEDTPFADLEPNSEVVGGTGGASVQSGFAYATLTVGGATNLNQGSRHSSGVNACLLDGSVR
jgi:prepilin-type processing-associated H-X9-DG protein